MATIITFANQKGGVGKTTLCTLFANYLITLNKQILVIDCDSQKSILEKRQSDIKIYDVADINYNVQSFNIADTENVYKLMQHLKLMDNIILVDSPGHLSQQGLIPLFINSDYIITPYQYEMTCINSTITFITFISKLKERIKMMQSQLIFVPNKFDKRYGKKNELELWKKTESAFSKYGLVLPPIPIRSSLQRYNTMSLLDDQLQIINDAFTQLINFIENE